MVGGSIYHGGRLNIPWWEVEYTIVGGSRYPQFSIRFSRLLILIYDRGFDIPWGLGGGGFKNTMGRGGRHTVVLAIGQQYKKRGFELWYPMSKGSKYYEQRVYHGRVQYSITVVLHDNYLKTWGGVIFHKKGGQYIMGLKIHDTGTLFNFKLFVTHR